MSWTLKKQREGKEGPGTCSTHRGRVVRERGVAGAKKPSEPATAAGAPSAEEVRSQRQKMECTRAGKRPREEEEGAESSEQKSPGADEAAWPSDAGNGEA